MTKHEHYCTVRVSHGLKKPEANLTNKKRKLSKLSDRDDEALAKLSKKERSLAVDGQPDQTDIDNLRLLFRTYDHYTQGRLTRMIKDNQAERALNDRTAKELPVDRAENLSFFLPKDLQAEVEKYWPSLWTNPAHLRWFIRHFPELRR